MTNEEILGMSKITTKFQVTIPKEVRNKCNFKEGDKILVVTKDDKLYLKASISSI